MRGLAHLRRPGPDEAHLWFASVKELSSWAAGLADTLSSGERTRMEAYRLRRDRRRFALSRGILRMLLASYNDDLPEKIRLHQASDHSRDDYAKPRLETTQDGGALTFSVSHAGDMIVYALSGGDDVGLDIEHVVQRFAWNLVARHFFSARELDELRCSHREDRVAAFFRIWTRKEAFAKATGVGLRMRLPEIAVSSERTQAGRLVRPVSEGTSRSWSLVDVSPCPQYAAALVTSTATRLTVVGWVRPDAKPDNEQGLRLFLVG